MTLDVLLWAHSDQSGGTEMPCAIAEAMLAAASEAPPRIGIITPFTEYIDRFFPKLNVQRYKSAPMLELRKYQDGSVNADETAKLVADRFKHLTITWGAAASIIQNEIDASTLIVSCGEPVALKVAKECKCTGIIVTDHLLTLSVRHVLEDGGLLDERTAPIMTEFESWDRSASGAFLSPLEFASPEYTEYLSMGGLHATPISGLFYESINKDAAEGSSAFQEIRRICGGTKVACVFAGGGTIWDDIIVDVDERARRGENSGFAVVNRKVVDRKPVKGEWLLHMPGNAEPIPILDPGKMMFWYPCCDLVVGRGGLVAQQVAATMISDNDASPEMLFIEEPGHPQIESERRQLTRLGLVHTRKLRGFSSDPFGVIADAMNRRNERRRILARTRYAAGSVRTLARAILSAFVRG